MPAWQTCTGNYHSIVLSPVRSGVFQKRSQHIALHEFPSAASEACALTATMATGCSAFSSSRCTIYQEHTVPVSSLIFTVKLLQPVLPFPSATDLHQTTDDPSLYWRSCGMHHCNTSHVFRIFPDAPYEAVPS